MENEPPTILIVDDNVELSATLKSILRSARFFGERPEVHSASCGEDATAIAKERGFDVAIVDIKLPDTSGVDLISKLREVSPLGEVLLVTGFANLDVAISALRVGAFAFVPKSFHPDELLGATEQALTKVRLKREAVVLQKRAADAEAMRRMAELALNLAHEIRNPLNAAVLQLHLLYKMVERQSLPDETKGELFRRVGIVKDEIGRLNRLLSEFLDLSRPRTMQKEVVRVDALSKEVFSLLEERASRASVTLREKCEARALLGDPERLKQVLLNLVSNALDALPNGGVVSVTATREGERVCLAVEDDGVGMDPETMRRAREPFFTTKEAGTGLGLAIVQEIVEKHDGLLELESEPGRGTVVRLRMWGAREKAD